MFWLFPIAAIVVAAVLLAAELPLLAADFRVCEDCHLERLEHDRGQPYQHQAFAGNDCSSCHVSAAPTPSAGKPAAAATPTPQQRITWLTDSILPDTSHYFLLAAEGLRDTLIISLRDQQGQTVREEMPLPPLAQLEAAEDNGRTPQLVDVRVVEVKRGVFMTVTIAWQTDALADAEVRYGIAELNQRIDSSGRLGFEHQLVLNQLQPNKSYRYQVVSRDLSGRESASEMLTFSTARADLPQPGGEQPALAGSGATAVEVEVRRRGDDYLLKVRLDQPLIVCIGNKGELVEQPLEHGVAVAMARTNKDPHAGLSDGTWSSMAACHQCHEKDEAASHPVNVLPPPGMLIPAAYPTLADGRMTCASCHAIHGSDQEYLTRKRSKRELCTGCHQDML